MSQRLILLLSLTHIVIWIIAYKVKNGKMDIFDPYYVISGLYILIFIYGPYQWLLSGKTSYFGVEVMRYLPEGMLYFNIGFFFFSIGSFSRLTLKQKHSIELNEDSGYIDFIFSPENRRKILLYAWTVYSVSMMLTILYYRLTGRSLLFMLTFGQGDERIGNISGFGLYVLAQFVRCAIPMLLLIILFSKRINISIVVATYLTSTICVSSGSRNLALCVFISVFCLHYLRTHSRPKVSTVILGIIFMYLFVGIIGIFRSSIRFGEAIDLSAVNKDSLNKALMYNVEIFYPFFPLVHKLRSGEIGIHYGLGLLYIPIQFIPRLIWKNRPAMWGTYGVEAVVGTTSGGAAYPNIGEFYYEFGLLGLVGWMFFYGIYMHRKYLISRNTNNPFTMARYSIIYGYILQFVCRGHFASWGIDFLLMFIPLVYIEKRISKGYLLNN